MRLSEKWPCRFLEEDALRIAQRREAFDKLRRYEMQRLFSSVIIVIYTRGLGLAISLP